MLCKNAKAYSFKFYFKLLELESLYHVYILSDIQVFPFDLDEYTQGRKTATLEKFINKCFKCCQLKSLT